MLRNTPQGHYYLNGKTRIVRTLLTRFLRQFRVIRHPSSIFFVDCIASYRLPVGWYPYTMSSTSADLSAKQHCSPAAIPVVAPAASSHSTDSSQYQHRNHGSPAEHFSESDVPHTLRGVTAPSVVALSSVAGNVSPPTRSPSSSSASGLVASATMNSTMWVPSSIAGNVSPPHLEH